ncbi:hypothetical protein EJ03DRAFT_27755 [Teratosphaeria nubilosa]|uniref:Uncharacterized protein n=1 Tax=Teratosphaeria nubilosa TaxID=161662 RepID=A0A6G1KW10_9PEZI|nr:hypothetical protein EJ03DRAFT_27755 [Teratosphaeria nubilosa]
MLAWEVPPLQISHLLSATTTYTFTFITSCIAPTITFTTIKPLRTSTLSPTTTDDITANMPSQMPYMRWQHNKRAASGTPSMANMNNNAMMNILKCKSDILSDLKRAFREQMQNYIVNGKPFLGQLPSEVDPSGQIREALWENVAKSDKKLRDTLNGNRYGSEKPVNFDANIAAVKNKICSDHTNERRKKRGAAAAAAAADANATAAYTLDKEVAVGSGRESGSDGGLTAEASPSLRGAQDVNHDNQMSISPSGEALQKPSEVVPRAQAQQITGVKRPAQNSWRSYAIKRQRAVPDASLLSRSSADQDSPLQQVMSASVDEEQYVSAPAQDQAGPFYAPAAVMHDTARTMSEQNAIPTIERESKESQSFRMNSDLEMQDGSDPYTTSPRATDTPGVAAGTFDWAGPRIYHDVDSEIKVEQRATVPPGLVRGEGSYDDAPHTPATSMQGGDRTASSSSERESVQYRPSQVSFFGKRSAMDSSGLMNAARGNDTSREEMPPPRFTSRRKPIVADDEDDDDNGDNEDRRGFRSETSRSSTGLFVSEVDHTKEAALQAKRKATEPRKTFSQPSGLGLRPLIEVEGMQTTVTGMNLPPSEGYPSYYPSYDDVPSTRSSLMRDESGAPSVKTPPPPREISESVGSIIEVAPAPTKAAAPTVTTSKTSSQSPDFSPDPSAQPATPLQTSAQAHHYPTRGRTFTSGSKNKATNATLLSPSLTASDTTTTPAQPANAGKPAKDKNKVDKLGDAMKTMIAYQVSTMAEKLSKDFDKKSKELEARLVDYVDQRLEVVAKQIGRDEDEELKERIRNEILREIRKELVGE